jgi:hypothetical protein
MIEILGYFLALVAFVGAYSLIIYLAFKFLTYLILKIPYFKRKHLQRIKIENQKIIKENKEKLEEELLLSGSDNIASAKLDILYYQRMSLRNQIAQKLKYFITMEERCLKCKGFIYKLNKIRIIEKQIEIKCDNCRDILIFSPNDKKHQDFERIIYYYKDFKYLNDVFDDGYKIRFTRQYFTKMAYSTVQWKFYRKNYTKPYEIYGIDDVFHRIFSNYNKSHSLRNVVKDIYTQHHNIRIQQLLDKTS